MVEKFDVIVIGAGQAGLAMGYHLSKHKKKYVILEKADSIVSAWRNRWDSFSLVLPNWTLQLPDFPYQGDDPDGFLSRDEMVEYLEQFAATFNPIIHYGNKVTSVEKKLDDGNYLVHTSEKTYVAENVVVATGTFQRAKRPSFHENIPKNVTQIHTSEYRNPEALSDGAVLVVGTGQSGCQIAEELYKSGRKVYLCVGSATRLPRFYRGKDSIWWLNKVKFFDQTVDMLDSPKVRFAGNPFLSGRDGGHSLNLHQFARDGVTLLGRLKDARGDKVFLSPDLIENLSKIDEFVKDVKQNIDAYIDANNIDADEASEQDELKDGFESEIIGTLDLHDSDIKTIVWAVGYEYDFSWVSLPVLDDYGYPSQQRGVSAIPGLYFLGLHWLYKRRSGLPWGVGDDAAHIADDIVGRT